MAFTAINEALLQIDEFQSVRYVIEAQVSKRYETPLEVIEKFACDTVQRFIILNVQTLETYDVTEQMAEAYIGKFEPERDDNIPPYVETSMAWADYLDALEPPINTARQYSTLNHAQTGVRS